MAVLPDFPGLAVEVLVYNAPRPEYLAPDEEDNDSRHATRYIEAVSGANFGVRVKVGSEYQHRQYDINVEVEIDGEVLIRKQLSRGKFYRQEGSILIRSLVMGSGEDWKRHKLRFSELKKGKFYLLLLDLGVSILTALQMMT
jgi:hypothetical protein